MNIPPRLPQRARGFVLIASLLLLLVMTLIGLAMFRSFGIQELIAGNVREKQRALQSAEAAEQYAELWLTYPGNVLSNTVDCSSTAVGLISYPYTSTAFPYICLRPVAAIDNALNATTVPWKIGVNEVGFTFYPGASTGTGTGGTNTGDMQVATTPAANTYYQPPRFYIALVSNSASQALYRIDAWNWGGTTNTAAVVEANYTVTCSTCLL
jgi:type IV pilus assembly protein PilX